MMLMKTQLLAGLERPNVAACATGALDARTAKPFSRRHEDLFAAGDRGGGLEPLDPEQRLYARGTTGGFAYVIVSGLVRFERVTAAGCRRIIRIAGSGDLIGQEALLRQAYRDEAVACTPVTLRRLSASLLDGAEWQTGRLPLTLMRRWQDTLDESEFWSTEVVTGSSRRRVLQLLAWLHLHRDQDGRIWLPKRDQMGAMLNITFETCSRVISALRLDGVLSLVPPRQAELDGAQLAMALLHA
jgi:CRP-like cAMP-binding protein